MMKRTLAGIVLALSVSCKQDVASQHTQPVPTQPVSQEHLPTIAPRDASTFWIANEQQPNDVFMFNHLTSLVSAMYGNDPQQLLAQMHSLLLKRGYTREQAQDLIKTVDELRPDTTYRTFCVPLAQHENTPNDMLMQIILDYHKLTDTMLGVKSVHSAADCKHAANIYIVHDVRISANTTFNFTSNSQVLFSTKIPWESSIPCHASGTYSIFVPANDNPFTAYAVYRRIMIATLSEGTTQLTNHLCTQGMSLEAARNEAAQMCERVVNGMYTNWARRTNRPTATVSSFVSCNDIKALHDRWNNNPKQLYAERAEDF